MKYTVIDDELDDVHVTAASVEPMPKADHKAKKHGKPYHKRKQMKPIPQRNREVIGGGHFVFGRLADGRVRPRHNPFEHPNFDAANEEAYRLSEEFGGRFEVYTMVNFVGEVGNTPEQNKELNNAD